RSSSTVYNFDFSSFLLLFFFFFSSRRRHTRSKRDWSSDVCSSDLQRFPDQVLKRLNTVLGQMHKYGHITKEEYDKAVKTDLDLDLHETPNGCTAAKSNAEFFCNYVQNVI